MKQSPTGREPLQTELAAPERMRVEQMVPGGQGLGHMLDGRAAFVSGAFVGDLLEILRINDKKSYVQVTDFRLIASSEERIEARCAVSEKCGGCDWMALSASAQHKHKLSLITQALTRTGRVELSTLSQPVTFYKSLEQPERPHYNFHYRSRVRLQVHGGQIGFYSAKSHELVTFQSCEAASKAVQEVIELLRPIVAQHSEDFSCVKAIEVRVLKPEQSLHPDHASIHVLLGAAKEAPTNRQKNALLAALLPLTQQLMVRLGRDKSAFQSFSVPSTPPGTRCEIQVAPGGFTQVNLDVNSELVERVLAESEGASNFLDIYCGSGNFSLPLLARGLTGVGVELNAEAIEAAQLGAQKAGLSAEFIAGPSERVLSDLVRRRRRFDLVIVDPPRAGAKPIVELLRALVVKKLVMISCDPVTLARDIQSLSQAGFILQTVTAHDMFPQTHHVETVAILTPTEKRPSA